MTRRTRPRPNGLRQSPRAGIEGDGKKPVRGPQGGPSLRPRGTVEPQYQHCLDVQKETGFARFGYMSNQMWHEDPKKILFNLARYKFVAKMLKGRQAVLEVGCGDAFFSRMVRQEVGALTAVDIDGIFVDDANAHQDPRWPITCFVHDLVERPVPGVFDGAYSLDVLEHIDPRDERRFLGHLVASLAPTGVLVIGTPSLESQRHASPISKAGHVNCKTQQQLETLLGSFFHNVFSFSMNDEVVHTGFAAMAHYLFAVCCTPRSVPVGGSRCLARNRA
ncbi:MAG: class I SAM-dependent methyltransferase [Candidatus Riflebacteria bacterium]|nr:class I SAM-dependent methyltransferase [Candidatus Riflebacteria bacterium]